jgi:hypothetical protein
MQRMLRVRAIVPLAAALVVSAATIARAQNATTHPVPPPHAYRLGTAARPFAWATAIGDLNADGRPDVAIADRVGRIGGGFAYSLELSIAGIGSRSVVFDAPDAALAISLLDVDHDHNLDVVVSAPISRTIVRVWLNDGHGRFREASPAAAAGARLSDPDSGAEPGAPAAAPPGAATPRGGVAPSIESRPLGALAGTDRLFAPHVRRARAPIATALQPRAPPRA